MSVKMRLGGFYRQRNGEIEQVVSRDEHPDYPWNGQCGRNYSDDGFEFGPKHLSGNDLMEEINPPSEPVELTRDELWSAIDIYVERLQRRSYEYGLIDEGAIELGLQIGRAAIAAYKATKNGGGV